MPINSTHPLYDEQVFYWRVVRDAMIGEMAIRAEIQRYLPVPPGLVQDGAGGGAVNLNDILNNNWQGQNRYTFYASFSEFPEITQSTIAAIQGLIHEKPPTIELPESMEYLREQATPGGDTLEELWEEVTRQDLTVGRMGLLTEIVGDNEFLCPYIAESIINWQTLPKLLGGGPILVVLKEVTLKPDPSDKYKMQTVETWRELELNMDGNEPVYRVRLWKAVQGDSPKVVKEIDGADEEGWVTPMIFGKPLNVIPFEVINAVNKGFGFGPMPALPLAKRAISIFRKSADYNRALYNKGDPQAWVTGVSTDQTPDQIGGGTIWTFENPEAKAGYLDIDGEGIPLMRESIMDQYDLFARETGQLADTEDGVESGEAIRRRQAGEQVTVKSIVVNAGASVEGQLREIGRLRGLSDAQVEEIRFTPNTDFAEPLMSGKALLDYVMSKNAGAPISQKTIHELARRHRVTDFSFDEELEEIATEEELAAQNEPIIDDEDDADTPDATDDETEA